MKDIDDADGDVKATVETIIKAVGEGDDIDIEASKELAKEHGGKVMIRREKKSASDDDDTQDLREEIEELRKTVQERKEALDDE